MKNNLSKKYFLIVLLILPFLFLYLNFYNSLIDNNNLNLENDLDDLNRDGINCTKKITQNPCSLSYSIGSNIFYQELIGRYRVFSSLDPLIFKKFVKKVDNKELYLIDIRTPQEYYSGHISNSINIDFYDKNFKEKLNRLNKNKIYLIYCRSGRRSNIAKKLMKDMGFKYVYDLKGGIKNWKKKGYEIKIKNQ